MSVRNWTQLATAFLCTAVLWPPAAKAQLEPETAHTILYFAHLADGGPATGKWQTTFVFQNPSPIAAATIDLYLYADDGQPLQLDFGSGPGSHFQFSIPSGGTRTFRSAATSKTSITGWAAAYANVPVVGTLMFRLTQNGAGAGAVSALGGSPTLDYRSAATPLLGVAIANVYSAQAIDVEVLVSDASGNAIATKTYQLGPLCHISFNLSHEFPSLPANFVGTIEIASPSWVDFFSAWTLHVDSDLGTFASLPSGALSWPVSQWDRIWDVFSKVWAVTQSDLLASRFRRFGATAPALNIGVEFDGQKLNAFAYSDKNGEAIKVTYGVAELISDSPSELAFVIAHEMGHVYQYRAGRNEFVADNNEFDADMWGFYLSMLAGYDPYAGAGALAKLAMVTGTAGLITQFEQQSAADAHKSFNTRLASIYDFITQICSVAPDACTQYKNLIHPGFPDTAPLRVRPRPVRR